MSLSSSGSFASDLRVSYRLSDFHGKSDFPCCFDEREITEKDAGDREITLTNTSCRQFRCDTEVLRYVIATTGLSLAGFKEDGRNPLSSKAHGDIWWVVTGPSGVCYAVPNKRTGMPLFQLCISKLLKNVWESWSLAMVISNSA